MQPRGRQQGSRSLAGARGGREGRPRQAQGAPRAGDHRLHVDPVATRADALYGVLADKQRPRNGYAAKFSLPYLLALMLVKERATLAEFTDEAARDRAVLAVAGKVGYEVDATIDYPRQFIGHVAVRLRDGRLLEERQDHPRGGPDFPMTREEVEAKFRGNASLAVPDGQAARVITSVGEIAGQPHVTALMESLTA